MDDATQRPALSETEALREEIHALRVEVARLNRHRFIRVQNSAPRMLAFMMMRGLALGLGTVIGASALVSVLAFALAQIDFIPIIGDWAADLARQIEAEVAAGREPAEGTSGAANADGSIAPGPQAEDASPLPQEGAGGE